MGQSERKAKKYTYKEAERKSAILKKEILEAMESDLLAMSSVCRALGIPIRTAHGWREADPEFNEAVKKVHDLRLDMVEDKAMEQIKQGNTAMIIFFLKTQGRKRGYVEQVDHSHKLDEVEEVFKVKGKVLSFKAKKA